MNNNDKHVVAIESTYDYTDKDFHQKLLNTEVQNPDGSYGQVGHLYRIVDLSETGHVKAMDDRVFESSADARNAIAENPKLQEVNYDSMIDLAWKSMQAQKFGNKTPEPTKNTFIPPSQQKKQEQNIEKRERRPARNQDKGMDK